MTTVCWTVLHHGGAHLAHAARHVARPIVHHAGRVLRHAPAVASHNHTWIEVVCKVIPAAVAGGGLLMPHPLNPPRLPAPPPFIVPAPAFSPAFPPGITFGPQIPATPRGGGPTRAEVTPEPSSALLLIGGLAGLLLARWSTHRSASSAGGA
jgi:hypothetical protein